MPNVGLELSRDRPNTGQSAIHGIRILYKNASKIYGNLRIRQWMTETEI